MNTLPTGIQTDSTALEKAKQISTTVSLLQRLYGMNDHATEDYYIQLHDSATTPAEGAVPKVVMKAFASANFYIDRSALPRSFKNGIYVCASSTAATKTLIGSNSIWFNSEHQVLA